jgi:hypothetical protein
MAANTFDLQHPEAVAHELGEANRRLAQEPEAPHSVVELAADVADAISMADADELAAVDPYLWIDIQRAALRAQAATREDDDRERRRQLRLALERLRFLIARLAERAPVSEDQPIGEVIRWLDDKLGAVAQPRKAELLDVAARTYQRWLSEHEPTTPSGDDEWRIRLIARIVNQLRHSLSGPGVVEWFAHPRDDLDGHSPQDLLSSPERADVLLKAALASRSSVAT